MKLIGNIGKEYINGQDKDVRVALRDCFRVGASVQEACDYVGVPRTVFNNWEYTYNELNKIKSVMYSYKLTEYIDITDNMIEEYQLNIELVNKLKKNILFGNDVYKLIESCNKAKAEVIIYHLTNIRSPKKNKGADWKASAWFLERTNPARYGRKDADEALANETDIHTAVIPVEFIDPKTADKRIAEMEEQVRKEIEGSKK
jgi:hypothetical protein